MDNCGCASQSLMHNICHHTCNSGAAPHVLTCFPESQIWLSKRPVRQWWVTPLYFDVERTPGLPGDLVGFFTPCCWLPVAFLYTQ